MVIHEWIRNKKNEIIDYKIIEVNPSFTTFTNLTKNESIGKLASELYNMNPPPYFEIYKRVYETDKSDTFETFYPPLNKYFIISVVPCENGFSTIFFDISQIKKREIEIQQNLNIKNMLLKELEHRTKNSFSLIASLIGLMISNYKGETLEVLTKIREQILILAKIYEILYFKKQENKEKIDISEIFSQIIENIKKGFKEIFNNVNISLSLKILNFLLNLANYLGYG